MILLLLISFVVTYGAWFLIHTFYAPYHLPAYLTFLCPRTWPWVSDIPTGPFHQWAALCIVTLIVALCVVIGFTLSKSSKVSFRLFSFILYILCLVEVVSFLFLTPNGINHLALQAKSGMNIIWIPIHYLVDLLPGFKKLSSVEKIRYVFTVPGATNAKLSDAALTHPPMFTLIGFFLYLTAKYIFSPLQPLLTAYGIHYIAFGWGVIVTLINATIIIWISYIAKMLFSEKTGRLTGVMVLTMPSVLFHVCGVMEGIPTVFLAAGILLLLVTLKYLSTSKTIAVTKILEYGLLTGLCFTMSAQFAYGFAVPIAAFLVSFLVMSFSKNKKGVVPYFTGMIIPALVYFIFEYMVSSGQSFWLIRSVLVTQQLNFLLTSFRPYPMSQIANFVVMSVMGGILWLPILFLTAKYAMQMIVDLLKKKKMDTANQTLMLRLFISGVFLCFLYLLFQKAVRLEVERTWYWFFFPIWSLSGMYMNSWNQWVRQNFQGKLKRYTKHPIVYLFVIQAVISIILATQIQDYY